MSWRLFLLVSMGLGLGLRAWNLGGASLWLDEIGSVMAARLPWHDLAAGVAQHLSPPLDYILLKLGQGILGHGDSAVRVPALLWGLLAIPLAAQWAKESADEATGRWMALLLALSPMAVAYAREARMYSLFLCLSALSWLLFRRWVEKPGGRLSVFLGLGLGAACLTHYYAFFMALGFLGLALWLKPTAWKQMLLVAGIAALLFMPWAPSMLGQMKANPGGIDYGLRPEPAFFKSVLSAFASHSGFRDAWFYGFGLLAAVGVWRDRLAGRSAGRQALLLMGGALLLLFGLAFYRTTSTTRNFIFLLPAFLFLAARGLAWCEAELRRRWPPWRAHWLPMLFLLLMAPALKAQLVHGREGYQPDWKAAAAFLKGQSERGPFWVEGPHSRACLTYYLDPNSELVFMAARSLDGTNRPGDPVRLMGDREMKAAVQGRLPGVLVLAKQPLSFLAGPQAMRLYEPLLALPALSVPGQRPEGEIRIVVAASTAGK